MPWIMNPTLVNHTAIVNPTTSLFLFQTATLEAQISALGDKKDWLGKTEGGVHAKNNQERSGDEAHIAKDLEYGVRISLLKYQTITH